MLHIIALIYINITAEMITELETRKFLEEGTLMMFFKHANILPLIGVVYEDCLPPMVILPYMAHGDLKSFIRKRKQVKSPLFLLIL